MSFKTEKPNTQTNMKVTTQLITPALAKMMLERNIGNRSVNQDHVNLLAREMSLGRWKLNGDTICLNGDRLIDGQHRLMAVLKSGVPIESLVVEGLSSEVFDTKDIGKRRSAADTLSVRGEVDCKSLAAALVVVDRYMTGRVGKAAHYTNMEIESLLNKYPGIRRSVRLCGVTKKLIPKSVLMGCHYLFSQKDEAAADAFVKKLISGAGISDGDPVYLLRERILQNSLSKAKLTADYLMALVIKSWNKQRAGTRVQHLRYRTEGDSPEAFPVVE